MARQIIGVILIIIGAVVAIHTIAEPLYFDSSQTESGYSEGVWALINPLIALAIIVGTILSFLRKRAVDAEGGVTWDRLAASVLFYGFVFVGILFFWNWFNLLSPRYNAIHPAAIQLVWIVIDAGFPILSASLGMRVFKGTGG